MSLIRGTALQGFPELVEELGGNPARLLAAAHIPLDAVGDQDSWISYRSGAVALEAAAAATSTGDFGRRLALRQGLEILGPVGVAARTAPTVGAALQAVEQYLSVYSPAIAARVDLQPDEPHARFEFRILLRRLPPHPQSLELSLGVALQTLRLFVGPDFRPISASIPHEPLTPSKEYVRYFGCMVGFSKPYAGFLVRRSDLARPLSSDSSVHTVVRDYLNSIVVPVAGQTIEPVRLLILRMLPTGSLDIELVASHLALHPRTLQRHLAAQGTSFAALVDEVRREQTERYLRDTDVPLGQLAGILGYSEQSVLSRSCQRWFGMSASAYRRNA